MASTSTAGQTAALEDAAREVGAPEWGDDTKRATCAFAAHLAIMSTQRVGGNISSMSVGPASVSYSVPSATEALESTAPGREFLRIRRGIAAFRFPMMGTVRV